MVKRFFQAPSSSFFLFGPRGTGKFTYLKQTFANALWIDLMDPEVFRFYAAGPERLKLLIEEHPNATTIVIDEIQKVPELLNVIHSLIEQKKGYQFVMTGSSARKLKQYGVNLLGVCTLQYFMMWKQKKREPHLKA